MKMRRLGRDPVVGMNGFLQVTQTGLGSQVAVGEDFRDVIPVVGRLVVVPQDQAGAEHPPSGVLPNVIITTKTIHQLIQDQYILSYSKEPIVEGS